MSFIADIGEAVFGEVHLEWNIEDFFSLSDKVDDFYGSPFFSFAGTRWYMKMYPNGETRYSSSGWVGLYLLRKDSDQPKTVLCFTMGIKGSNGVEEKVPRDIEREFSSETELGYGFPKAWLRSDLRSRRSILLPDNVLTITCDLRKNARISVNSEKKLLKSLQDVLESGDDSDVVLKVQGKEFPAHRVILRARSPVFRSMFQHDMLEKQKNMVTIEDCDQETFPDFLVHIYSGKCDQISTDNVHSLFMAADKYDFGELKAACADFMERNLSVANFCDIMTLAVRHGEKKLVESATKFFCGNSLDIVKMAEWQIFLKDNLTVGNELIIKALSK